MVKESTQSTNKIAISSNLSGTTVPTAVALTHGERPKKFNRADFKHRQQKIFYLTTLRLAKLLTKDAPKVEEVEHNATKVGALNVWKNFDFICKNYVLNELDNSLYNVCTMKTSKDFWISLDKKYKTEDAGMKKFVVGKFLDFKMIDAKTVISQIQELQVILYEIHDEGMSLMSLGKSFQVAAAIKNYPVMERFQLSKA